MDSIYGQKVGMTRVFTEDGDSVGVTVIKVDPATVIRVKNAETDGYNAVVLGFGEIREKLLNKPNKGQFKKAGVEPKRHIREVRIKGDDIPEPGTVFGADVFKSGEKVHVTGISRGHGFQGGVKRHGFAGGPKTHGQSDRLRAPGSIGQSSYPSRVFKGQRMPGRMGRDRVTMKNLRIFAVEPEESLILIKGVIPGHKNSLVMVRKAR
jgi:large subunit ribosomal protein L3